MPDINWTDKKYQEQIAESWKKKPKQPKLYDMSFSKELCSKSIAPHPSWYRQMPILPILPRNLGAKKKEIKFSNEQQEGDLSASKLFCRSIACTLHMLCCVLLWRSLDLLVALCASTDITSTCTALFPPSIHLSTKKLFHFLFEKKSFQKFYDIWSSCSENTYKCTLKTKLNEDVNSLVYLLQDWMKNHRVTIATE